jgi:hypothetical protein
MVEDAKDQEPEPLRSENRGLTAEDFVLIGVMALGFLGSPLMYALKLEIPAVMHALLLGSSVAALVYRFLGGIATQTSFAIGALKVGGSLAALLGTAIVIYNLFPALKCSPPPPELTLDELFKPNVSGWFAMDKATALPIPVEIASIGKQLPLPSLDALANTPLALRRSEGRFVVAPKRSQDFAFGMLAEDDVRGLGLNVSLSRRMEGFRVTKELKSGVVDYDLDPLPLKLKTGKYDEDFTRYALVDADGKEHPGNIRLRDSEVVQVGTRFFLVAVVEINHHDAEPWARFAVGEIETKIDL